MKNNNYYEIEMNSLITNMYLKKYPKKQRIYEIILIILIFIPIVLAPIIGVEVENNALFYVLICCFIFWGTVGVIASIRKKLILKKMYKIKNASNNFNIINATGEMINELKEDNALVFFGRPNTKLLDFVYNVLNNCNAINDSKINLYQLNIKIIRDNNNYDYSKMIGNEIPNDTEIFCIKTSALNLNDGNLRDFLILKNSLRLQYFDDFINFVCKNDMSI